MYALYARQSVEKQDSISVESQLEFCRYEARGQPYREYVDRGFSGKNTSRPAFEQMVKDIRQGEISTVVVYKLDRISRSILDFSNMMELFGAHQVEFISSTEKFDTSTPIGRAMLNICIVFAQLERETIQKRVTDAYVSRSRKGLYMGGRLPYGFRTEETIIDGVHTSRYVPVPKECEQLRLLYSLYEDPAYSLGDIVRYLENHDIRHLRGSKWNTARISELLRNPIYVKADETVYRYFKEEGATFLNSPLDYVGRNACYLLRGSAPSSQKASDLHGREVVLAPHEGIVSADVWLRCRSRCQQHRRMTQTCRSTLSWLCGKVKCASCGRSLIVVQSKTRWGRYMVCSGQKAHLCSGVGATVYVDVLEQAIETAIFRKLQTFPVLKGSSFTDTPQHHEKKRQLAQLAADIDELLARVPQANEVLIDYINRKINVLEGRRHQLEKDLSPSAESSRQDPFAITDHPQRWLSLPFASKQAVVDTLIDVVRIGDGVIEICWNL